MESSKNRAKGAKVKRWHRRILSVGAAMLVLLVGGVAWFGTMGRRVEEPGYRVLKASGDIELRAYGARLVAETRVSGDREAASREGFRRLAAFIFGANKSQEKVAMTAPVAQRATRDATEPTSEKIAMTAPVGQRDEGGIWVISFTMPAEWTLASLPEPNDSRVAIREQPAERIAMIRFSGLSSKKRIREQTVLLKNWVRGQKLVARGKPELNRYDPPWTPRFLRRNEIWLRLEQGP